MPHSPRSPQAILWLHQQLQRPQVAELIEQLGWQQESFELTNDEATKLANASNFQLKDQDLDRKRKVLVQGLAAVLVLPSVGTLYTWNFKWPHRDRFSLKPPYEGDSPLEMVHQPENEENKRFWLARLQTNLGTEAIGHALEIAHDLWCGGCRHVEHHVQLGLRSQTSITKHSPAWEHDCEFHCLAGAESLAACRRLPLQQYPLEQFVETVALNSNVGVQGNSLWGLANVAQLNATQIQDLRSGMLLYRIQTCRGRRLEIVPLPICAACGCEVTEQNRCHGPQLLSPRNPPPNHVPEVPKVTTWLIRQGDRIEGGIMYRCHCTNHLFFGSQCPNCRRPLGNNHVTHVWVPPASSLPEQCRVLPGALARSSPLLAQLNEQQLTAAFNSFDTAFDAGRFPAAEHDRSYNTLIQLKKVLGAYKALAVAVRKFRAVVDQPKNPGQKQAMTNVANAKRSIEQELRQLAEVRGGRTAVFTQFDQYLSGFLPGRE